jgi:hypothetical protein
VRRINNKSSVQRSLEKLRWLSLGTRIRYTRRILLRRSVCSEQERRKSVSSLRLRRLQKQLNAGLKESVIRRFRTLKKLYNYPKEAEAGLQKLQQLKRSLRVVL